jgi:hypothetical protein
LRPPSHPKYIDEKAKLEAIQVALATLREEHAVLIQDISFGTAEKFEKLDDVTVAMAVVEGADVPNMNAAFASHQGRELEVRKRIELLARAERKQVDILNLTQERAAVEIVRKGAIGEALRSEIAKQNELLAALVASNARIQSIRDEGFQRGLAPGVGDYRFLARQTPDRFDDLVRDAMKRVV